MEAAYAFGALAAVFTIAVAVLTWRMIRRLLTFILAGNGPSDAETAAYYRGRRDERELMIDFGYDNIVQEGDDDARVSASCHICRDGWTTTNRLFESSMNRHFAEFHPQTELPYDA